MTRIRPATARKGSAMTSPMTFTVPLNIPPPDPSGVSVVLTVVSLSTTVGSPGRYVLVSVLTVLVLLAHPGQTTTNKNKARNRFKILRTISSCLYLALSSSEKAKKAYRNEVQRHDEIQQPGHDENQYPRD